MVEALTFDVFGTVVDWRGSIQRLGERFGRERGLVVDWGALADAWRAGYRPAMDRVRRGEWPWMNLDHLHRRILDEILPRFGLGGLGESERRTLVRFWHQLDPWPDVVAGLRRLKRRYLVATLSNGHVRLLADMARRAELPWDVILSAELARQYKPDPAVYRTAAELLDLPPSEVMMVAAHGDDLRAAAAVGFRTAFVRRPLEHGEAGRGADEAEAQFDLVAEDFLALAEALGT
ncbi:MAG: haloacid dehalogenase type II [Actinomycetia bacterium]|jgi:2-haloacid dehalogenase|nr:haloacid dehalogenase type II [Actinomycetes bacterium]